jgi:hypothetical protein
VNDIDPGDMREEFFVICQTCYKKYTMHISKNDFYAWEHGKYVQDAFPYLNADERELLISHTCGSCFDAMFPEEE